MNDRELLEAAAKAAGIRVCWHGGDAVPRHMDRTEPPRIYWNPLTDDGDALRLAVKLNIDIFSAIEARMCETDHGTTSEPEGDDPMAAQRRAIVRAAASLSSQEKPHG